MCYCFVKVLQYFQNWTAPISSCNLHINTMTISLSVSVPLLSSFLVYFHIILLCKFLVLVWLIFFKYSGLATFFFSCEEWLCFHFMSFPSFSVCFPWRVRVSFCHDKLLHELGKHLSPLNKICKLGANFSRLLITVLT